MEDYPRNLAELERRFASDEACRDYLMFLRWPDGFRCPRCGGDKFWPQRITLLQWILPVWMPKWRFYGNGVHY